MDLQCKDCGYIGEPVTREFYENDDADGNRGIWVTYEECRKCGSEDLTEDITDDESD